MAKRQRVCCYSGAVQGVGFRYTTCRVAAGFEVNGYVRNLPDGRVECLIEGETDQIDAFCAEVASRMRGYIREATTAEAPYTGAFASFGVRY